jgi:hypothetical protein
MLPLEVAKDKRLSQNDLRVLIVISCIAGKSKLCHPKRETLAELTGLPTNKISVSTRRLSEFGWLIKKGNGGRNSPAIYEISNPETRTESVHLLDEETRTESVRLLDEETRTESVPKTPKTRTESVPESSKTRTDSVRGKEKKENNINIKYGISLAGLPEEITTAAATEFIAHRKNMKKPLTQEAFRRAMNAAVDASCILGISADKAIHETIDAGWQGIKASWLKKRLSNETHQRSKKHKTRSEQIGDAIFGEGTEIDFLGMGEADSEVREPVDEPDCGPKAKCNYPGGMGGEVIPVQRGEHPQGGRFVGRRIPPNSAEAFRAFEAHSSDAQNLQDSAKTNVISCCSKGIH